MPFLIGLFFQVMRDLFPAILSVAEIFLHAVDPCVVSFGSCMYKGAYAAFDSYCQQVQKHGSFILYCRKCIFNVFF